MAPKKKKSAVTKSSYQYATLLDGPIQVGEGGMQFPIDPKRLKVSSVVLVETDAPGTSPFQSFYEVIAFVGELANATTIFLSEGTYFWVALPNGYLTPLTEIAAVITNTGSGGPPGGVGPTGK